MSKPFAQPHDLESVSRIRQAALLSTQILDQLRIATKVGATPAEINQLAGKLCNDAGAKPAFYDVTNQHSQFAANLCISVNDAVLHGLPSSMSKFADGDLVKLDFGLIYEGMYTDQCITVGLGVLSAEDKSLINVGKLAVQAGVAQAKPGNTTGDIGYAIQTMVETAGFNVLKDYVGHAIGRTLWEEPQIPAFGYKGGGDKLIPGQVICIEAQIVAGSDDTYVGNDGWTVYTQDGKNGVMFEYMVLITETGSELLTPSMDWPVFGK